LNSKQALEPVILVVNPDSNVHSIADLIALAKSKPGQVLHGTVVGSLPHLASELFTQHAGRLSAHIGCGDAISTTTRWPRVGPMLSPSTRAVMSPQILLCALEF